MQYSLTVRRVMRPMRLRDVVVGRMDIGLLQYKKLDKNKNRKKKKTRAWWIHASEAPERSQSTARP